MNCSIGMHDDVSIDAIDGANVCGTLIHLVFSLLEL